MRRHLSECRLGANKKLFSSYRNRTLVVAGISRLLKQNTRPISSSSDFKERLEDKTEKLAEANLEIKRLREQLQKKDSRRAAVSERRSGSVVQMPECPGRIPEKRSAC